MGVLLAMEDCLVPKCHLLAAAMMAVEAGVLEVEMEEEEVVVVVVEGRLRPQYNKKEYREVRRLLAPALGVLHSTNLRSVVLCGLSSLLHCWHRYFLCNVSFLGIHAPLVGNEKCVLQLVGS